MLLPFAAPPVCCSRLLESCSVFLSCSALITSCRCPHPVLPCLHTNDKITGSLYTVAALDGQTRGHLEECIRGVASDAAHRCVMCVGHNKGWEEAASSLARRAVRLHTASAALFEAAGRSWHEATAPEAEWRLVQVLAP